MMLLKICSWLCVEVSLLVGLGERGKLYGMLGVEPKPALCKTSVLPTVLSTPAPIVFFWTLQ